MSVVSRLKGRQALKYFPCLDALGQYLKSENVAFLITVSSVQYGIIGKGAGDLLRENQQLKKLGGVTSSPDFFFSMKTI